MKLLILGNAGSGKTTLAQQIAGATGARVLSMDRVAFLQGTERRALTDSIALLESFLAPAGHCIVEGCYGDLSAAIAPRIEQMLLLNPGTDACAAHCSMRPWEPDKFDSPEAQDALLAGLLDWVRRYEDRNDEFGYQAHRQVFDAFPGGKLELSYPAGYLLPALELIGAAAPGSLPDS